MKRMLSVVLIMLFLLTIGCTTNADGANSTTTTTDAGKLVTLDISVSPHDYYIRDQVLIPPGTMQFDPMLSAAFQNPINEGARFRVLVYTDGPEAEKRTALVKALRSLNMPVDAAFTDNYRHFFTQGTKEQLEALTTIEPVFGYYLWLAHALQPTVWTPN